MAVLYRTSTGIDSYNVESRVGIGLRASRLDVKLVQFLLTKATRWTAQEGLTKQSYVLQQDGIFGPNTRKALLAFQNAWDGKLLADGMVSPMRGNTTRWAPDRVWSIAALQKCYAMGESGVGTNMPSFMVSEIMRRACFDPEAAPDLRSHLAAIQASA